MDTSRHENSPRGLCQRHGEPILLFVLGFFLLFWGISRETGVTGKDEFWVTFRTPLEMMERGSYWTLWLNDEVRLQKPPLLYWVIIAFYKLFGISTTSARLVGVLSGAGMAAVTAMLHRRLFGTSGWLAGMVLLGCAGVAVEGRRAMLDLPLGFFCLASVYAAVAGWRDQRTRNWVFSGLWLAAACLSKGPQAILFVGAAFASALVLRPSMPPPRRLLGWSLCFLGVFLLVALPWPLSMAELHRGFREEVGVQLVESRFGRFHAASPLTALSGALLLVFPWTFMLLAALLLSFRRGHRLHDRRIHWLVLWYLFSVLPFFFLRSFERYMIPILPCVAILVAEAMVRLTDATRRRVLLSAVALLGMVVVGFACFAIWFRLALVWPLICILVLVPMAWFAVRPDGAHRTVLTAALLFAATLGGLYPSLGINALPDNLPWEELHSHPVGIYGSHSQPAMISLRLKRSADLIREDRLLREGYRGYIFTTADHYDNPNRPDTLVRALKAAKIPYEEVLRYRAFFSRRSWVRFARPDATKADWLEALRSRDLENLKSEIVLVRTGARAR